MKYFLLSLSFLTLYIGNANAQINDAKSTSEKFNTLLYYIENMYVDSVNAEELVEVAIINMLETLDPHSQYISKEELDEANEPLNGSFDGIGVQFNILKDTIFIVSTISGGPSEKLGIMAGDKIIMVDGEKVAGIGITNRDVMQLLKGPRGTKVTVGIKRGDKNALIDFDIIRDKIPLYSIDAHFMAAPTIGYVKVNRFAKTTPAELRAAIADLQKQGMESLVLDLQGNGGGLLNAAIEMADEFLSEDKLIVYTEGRKFPRNDANASYKGSFEKGKLIVLVDEGSASASEIVSGAIQDWDRGLIIGRRSFGKGLVQRPVSLPDGSAVRLTVQKYYTPSGRCIQKPYDEGMEAYRMEKYDRFENGELTSQDSVHLPDSLKFETKIKKRTVYGGGGIMPDIFVPIDTSYTSDYFSALIRKGILNQMVLTYVDENRVELENTYPNSRAFLDNFEVSDEMLKILFTTAENKDLPFVEADYETSAAALQIWMKAMIGRNLFDYSVFYEIINVLNPAYMKAIRSIEDGTFDKMKLAHQSF